MKEEKVSSRSESGGDTGSNSIKLCESPRCELSID